MRLATLCKVVAEKFAEDAETQVVPVGKIPEGWMGLDVVTHLFVGLRRSKAVNIAVGSRAFVLYCRGPSSARTSFLASQIV